MANSRKKAHPNVYALLYLTRQCQCRITEFLLSRGTPASAVQEEMHLTVYHARRLLPSLPRGHARPVAISADTRETRFMVLAPGGENPKPELDPARRSLGIRLTKRNAAIEDIQTLRAEMCQLETPDVIGTRKPSTRWTSCFGARHYQPHIKLLRPGNTVDRDLTMIGQAFRERFQTLEFGSYQITTRRSVAA